jgi:hypothetical protein
MFKKKIEIHNQGNKSFKRISNLYLLKPKSWYNVKILNMFEKEKKKCGLMFRNVLNIFILNRIRKI